MEPKVVRVVILASEAFKHCGLFKGTVEDTDNALTRVVVDTTAGTINKPVP